MESNSCCRSISYDVYWGKSIWLKPIIPNVILVFINHGFAYKYELGVIYPVLRKRDG